jgi:bifunctional ADP-heptose synthase (sugar kinase/adenylyltransferase)
MSKFTVETYSNSVEILKFDHKVSHGVLVDDSGISANDDGKKLVPAGTIVGGKTEPALGAENILVEAKNTASVAATLTVECTNENSDVLFTAKKAGTAGNSVKVAYVVPSANDEALAVSVSGDTVTVSLATADGAGAITSTATEVAEAVNAHLVAKTLVTAEAQGTGEGVVEAKTAAALSEGTDGNASDAEGILLWDVDVTHGPTIGTMVIHGFINLANLPEDPVDEAKAVLKQLTFIN